MSLEINPMMKNGMRYEPVIIDFGTISMGLKKGTLSGGSNLKTVRRKIKGKSNTTRITGQRQPIYLDNHSISFIKVSPFLGQNLPNATGSRVLHVKNRGFRRPYWSQCELEGSVR
jgi:hypothetical protein